MFEKWKIVPGQNDRYEASDMGRIRNTYGRKRVHRATGGPRGYKQTSMNGKTVTTACVILETFVGPRPPGCCANHKNDDRSDNTLRNLEWKTRKFTSLVT